MSNNGKRKYEAMFLVDSAVAAANWDDVVGRIGRIMQRAEAEVCSLRKWDERRLCHEVRGRKRGTYILCYFDAPPGRIPSIERDVQIDEDMLRVLILSAEDIPAEIIDAPTPIMQAEQAGRPARAAEEGEPRYRGRRDEAPEGAESVAAEPRGAGSPADATINED